jgi:CRISPR/Cas system CMR-associated protein Cmr5 small subunit
MARYTRDQIRAAIALERFRQIKNSPGDLEAWRRLESLPAMILENGLLVTLAFLNSKDSLRPIRDAMQAWLHDEKSLIPWGDNPPPDLADRLRVTERTDVFRMAGYEAIQYSNWLKRWAQAYPPPTETAAGEDTSPGQTEPTP